MSEFWYIGDFKPRYFDFDRYAKVLDDIRVGRLVDIVHTFGGGKSFIGINTSIHFIDDGTYAIIAVPTVALEEQYVKIIESIRDSEGIPIHVVHLRGRRHFICPRRGIRADKVPARECRECPKKVRWGREARKSGSKPDFEYYALGTREVEIVAIPRDPCPYYDQYARIYEVLMSNSRLIVITNYSKLVYDILLRRLPRPRIVIFDESDYAILKSTSIDISESEILTFISRCRAIAKAVAEESDEELISLVDACKNQCKAIRKLIVEKKTDEVRDFAYDLLVNLYQIARKVFDYVVREDDPLMEFVTNVLFFTPHMVDYITVYYESDDIVFSYAKSQAYMLNMIVRDVPTLGMTATPLPQDWCSCLLPDYVRYEFRKKMLGKAEIVTDDAYLLKRRVTYRWLNPGKGVDITAVRKRWRIYCQKLKLILDTCEKPALVYAYPWYIIKKCCSMSEVDMKHYEMYFDRDGTLLKRFVETEGKEPPIIITARAHRGLNLDFVKSIVFLKFPMPKIFSAVIQMLARKFRSDAVSVAHDFGKINMIQTIARAIRSEGRVVKVYTPDPYAVQVFRELAREYFE